jgi:uncharacterized membrane protein
MSRWLLVSVGLTAAALAAALVVYFGYYDALPDPVPVHWDLHGRPDDFVPRDRALPYLLIGPGVMALMVVLTVVLPHVSPVQFDVNRFRPTYDYLMALVVGLLGYVSALVLAATLGAALDVSRVMLAGAFLFFAALGNVLGKVQRNFWIGVRTPWTLASETVWIRTHRLTAWLWGGGGLVGFAAVLLGLHVVGSLVLLAALTLSPVFYSLVLYKRLEKEGRLGPPASSAPLSSEEDR